MDASPWEPPAEFNLADYFLFDRLDEGLGDKIAVRWGDQEHSYADTARSVRSLAAHLLHAGIRQQERVLIVLEDNPAFVWSFFATLRAGAVVAMGNPAAPIEDLAYLVRYTQAHTVIAHDDVALALSDVLDECQAHAIVVKRVATGEDVTAPPRAVPGAVALGDELALHRESVDQRRTHRDDPAIWLFTSGSTGRPKAAMHAHRDFVFNTERYAMRTVGYRRDDVTVSVPRLFFGYATGTNLMFPFRVGATTALFSERPTPENLAAAITRYRPTVVTNVPTMMGKLLDDDDPTSGERLDMSSVRFHLSAGEALPPALLERFIERFGGEVYDGIGSAEMFHIYCSNRPGDVKPASLGRVVEGYEIRILDVAAEGPGAPPVSVGDSGVMWVKGDSVAFGYFQDRPQSWATFHGHWCRTGDLFRVDEEGYYWFEGRADDLLKVGGIWVAPVEVEACLGEHPAVSIAAVIGSEQDGLVKPKAFVVLRETHRDADHPTLATELKDHVKRTLSKHKYPRWIVFTDDLPKNDRGKIAKSELTRRETAGENPIGD
jgi:benzoate-CoA ligase family protein